MKQKNNDWDSYVGKHCKLVYKDGEGKDGSPHYSTKKGVIDKSTDTHIVLLEDGKNMYTAINLSNILRLEIKK